MKRIKTAYELACERIIAPPVIKTIEEEEKETIDFIKIPEFSDKEDKVLESIGSTEEIIKKNKIEKDKKMKKIDYVNTIRVQEPETIHIDSPPMEIIWNGHFLDYGGFARMNRTYVFGLSNKNVKVKIEIEPYLVHVNQSTQRELHLMENNIVSPSAIKIFGTTVPTSHITHSGKKILYTMIETSGTLHKDYRDKLNMFDEIWVPTHYAKKIFQENNIHPPIYVMPLGVDTSRYKMGAGIVDFGHSVRKFKFLSVFKWSYRKGVDILLKAFMEEFDGDEDVSLILISRSVDGIKSIKNDFDAIRNSVNKSEQDLPHIMLITKLIHEKDMPSIYNSANAFVLISRGEGWGLPYCEAAACGLPIIASNCPGHFEFLSNENSYLVDPEGYIKAEVNGEMSKMAKLCYFYEGQMFPNFQQKSIEQTKQLMRHVYDNYIEAKTKAEKLKQLILKEYTWEKAINRVYNRICQLNGR